MPDRPASSHMPAVMDRVDSLLERFPGPVTLPMSRGRWQFIVGGTALFSGAIAWNAIQPTGIVGWLLILFCVAGATGLAVMFIRGGRDRSDADMALILDATGFSINEGRSSRRFEWAAVENFAVVPDRLAFFRTRVGFNPSGLVIDETNGFAWRKFELPEAYGLTNDGCVRLLSQWQQRALAGTKPPQAA